MNITSTSFNPETAHIRLSTAASQQRELAPSFPSDSFTFSSSDDAAKPSRLDYIAKGALIGGVAGAALAAGVVYGADPSSLHMMGTVSGLLGGTALGIAAGFATGTPRHPRPLMSLFNFSFVGLSTALIGTSGGIGSAVATLAFGSAVGAATGLIGGSLLQPKHQPKPVHHEGEMRGRWIL